MSTILDLTNVMRRTLNLVEDLQKQVKMLAWGLILNSFSIVAVIVALVVVS